MQLLECEHCNRAKVVEKMRRECDSILRLLALLLKYSLDRWMLGIKLLDAIPCGVKAEYFSNCNKSRIFFQTTLAVIVEY